MPPPKGARKIDERWATSPTSAHEPALDILDAVEDPTTYNLESDDLESEEPIALDPSALIEEPGTIDLHSVEEPETLKRPRAIVLPTGHWPACVPGHADAAFALTGTMVPPFLADITNAMRHELTRSEHRALNGKDPDLYVAVTLRWRLAIAFELAPRNKKDPEIDRPAFEALLAELDKTLHTLGLIRPDGSERAQVAHLARSALLRSAAFLSQLAPRKTEAPSREAPPRKTSTERPPPPPPMPNAQRVTVATQDLLRRTQRRAIVFLVLFVVSALGTGAFHYWRWKSAPPPPARLPIAKNPAGTLLRANTADGVLVLHTVENGKPVAAEKIRAFRAAAEKDGKLIMEMSKTSLIAVPKEVPGGSTAPKKK